ncbi:shikimate dehydrogenase [soil metagenome]
MTRLITGAAKLGGIVGRPVAHSLSPVIHNAWIEAAGMDAVYAAFSPPDEAAFDTLVAFGRAGMLAGVNVTAPFKEQAFAAADEASDEARASGSANVLAFRDGRVHAESTDGFGLLHALADQAPALTLKGATVVMLGAGGAARAAAGTLIAAGAQVRIVNRSRDRAQTLADDLGEAVTVVDEAEAFDDAALVVNALSIPPTLDLARLEAGTVVMDMTYRPVETDFLKAAKARGLTPVDGLGMLIGQAGPSFRAIFGIEPPALNLRPLLLAAIGAPA